MAQPPDDGTTTAPGAPKELTPADDATIPWTPPEPAPIDPGSSMEPVMEPVMEPPSPLISWTPSGGEPLAPLPVALPGDPTPAMVPAGAPLVGWQQPVVSAQPTAVDGYAIASTWARLVAYAIDGTLYFVGFWTSSGGATLGMRALRMRVVDAVGRDTLTLSQAIRRWVVLGAPLSLLGLIPALQSAVGFAGAGLSLVLLITVATDDQRQGLHDKVAGTIVGRSVTSGAGAMAVGCLLLIAIAIGLAIVVGTIAANEMLPQLQEYFQDLEPVS